MRFIRYRESSAIQFRSPTQRKGRRTQGEAHGWRDIATAPKDRTPVLLLLKNSIPADGRDDLRPYDGLIFVGRHPGVPSDGYDVGWAFAAPVGCTGFPDDWIEGWQPLPEAAPVAAEDGKV